jgi:hypothetical protein
MTRKSGSSSIKLLIFSVVEAYTFDFTYHSGGAELGITTSVKKGKKVVGSHKSALKENSGVDASQETIYCSLKVRGSEIGG